MGMRSILKYMTLFRIVSYLIEEGGQWLTEAQDEDSLGGEDITALEYLELADIVENALVMALGLDVDVSIFDADEDYDFDDEDDD